MRRSGVGVARACYSGTCRWRGLLRQGRPVVWAVLSLIVLAVPALAQRGSVLAGLAPDVRLGAHALPLVEVGGP